MYLLVCLFCAFGGCKHFIGNMIRIVAFRFLVCDECLFDEIAAHTRDFSRELAAKKLEF